MNVELVYTTKEVAKILKCSESSVNNMRANGTLHEIKGIAGIRYSKKEVECLLGIVDEYTPMAYRKLKAEVERLRKENHKLKSEIKKITSQMLVMVNEEL